MYACMHACMLVCTRAYMHTCMHACMHVYVSVCRQVDSIHKHTHTNMNLHTWSIYPEGSASNSKPTHVLYTSGTTARAPERMQSVKRGLHLVSKEAYI